MATSQLNFPNSNRSYEPARGAVHFWGHDQSMEVSFYVTADALKLLDKHMQSDEAGFLQAFDVNRRRIEAAAVKAYSGGKKGSYDLNRAAF